MRSRRFESYMRSRLLAEPRLWSGGMVPHPLAARKLVEESLDSEPKVCTCTRRARYSGGVTDTHWIGRKVYQNDIWGLAGQITDLREGWVQVAWEDDTTVWYPIPNSTVYTPTA